MFQYVLKNFSLKWKIFRQLKLSIGSFPWKFSEFLCYPVMLSDFSPAPVKTDRAVRVQQTNQGKVITKGYNESLRLIDCFCTCPGKLPYGYNSPVDAKSDST